MRAGMLLGLAACGRLGFGGHDVPDAPAATDAATDAALGPWSAPLWMGSTLNSTSNDADATVPADELELYFASDRPGGPGMTDIYVSTRPDRGSPWSAPILVPQLSTTGQDDSPEISPDGLTMWLAAGPAAAHTISITTRPDRTTAWSTPIVDGSLSSTLDDSNIAVSGDARVAIIEHLDADGNRQLYQHRRVSTADGWGPELLLAELASPGINGAPCLDDHGLVVYWNSNRAGSAGEYDIYVATRASVDDPFGAPQVDAQLSSPQGDGNPFMAPDGHTMYIHSDRPGGLLERDLWAATR